MNLGTRRLASLLLTTLFLALPAVAADMAKTLRVAFVAPENGFDPQATGDLYSNYVNREIFDPLYRYDYLARPYKVIPNTAAALPEISADGLTWTIKLRPGTYFTDDPAFKGKKRELTAADYVYGWKRLIDPKLRSINAQIFDDRLVGAKAAIEAAKKTGKFDYDAPLDGAQAVDRYTIRLKLNYPAYDLLADLTGSGASAVVREVMTAYGDPSGWNMEHPVGTGPYYLKSWRRGQQIVLEANPTFRDVRFPDSSQPEDRAMLGEMRGKKLPVIGRIEIAVIEESNPRLLAFEKGELDYIIIPTDLVPKLLNGDKLKPEYVARGIVHLRGVQPTVVYTYFNMEDPVVGGYTRTRSRCVELSAWRTTMTTRFMSFAWTRRRSRRSRSRRTSTVTTPRSRAIPRTTSPGPRRCSTSSATWTATAMAGAICRTASRLSSCSLRTRPRSIASSTSSGSEAWTR